MVDFNRCYGCMHENTGRTPCPYCGYDASRPVESALSIHPGYLLSDRYIIGKVLGQGGFGITYLGWDTTLDMIVAIKEYLPLSIATRSAGSVTVSCVSADARENYKYGLSGFLNEARILALFNETPNIVGVRDFFEANGTAYMVMEYVDGMNFKQYIEKHGGKIPWDQSRSILMFIGDALKEVHAKNLLHRDVSPDNIFITSKNQIKLLDFGAARVALGMKDKSISIMLKQGYAPYEQYSTRGNQGPWTDVYALAATMYKSITGVLPPESLERLEGDTLQPPSALGVDIPQFVENAIMKGLAVRPSDRFQSIVEFQQALLGATEINPTVGSTGQQPVNRYSDATVRYTSEVPQKVLNDTLKDTPKVVQSQQKGQQKSNKNKNVLIAAAILLICLGGGFAYMRFGIDTPEKIYAKAISQKGTHPDASFKLMKDLVNDGYEPAKMDLAEMYIAGDGVTKDPAQGAALLLPLANAGNPNALYLLGELYVTGSGVAKNVGTGIDYLERAAEQGIAGAHYKLANIYEEGLYVKTDLEKAAMYYDSAGDFNDAQARKDKVLLKIGEEKERIRKAEEERLKQQEAERLRKAEEQKKKQEAERLRKAEAERKRKQQAEREKLAKAQEEQKRKAESVQTMQRETNKANNSLEAMLDKARAEERERKAQEQSRAQKEREDQAEKKRKDALVGAAILGTILREVVH